MGSAGPGYSLKVGMIQRCPSPGPSGAKTGLLGELHREGQVR